MGSKSGFDTEILLKPYTYLRENTRGKGFRNQILAVFNLYFGLSHDELSIVQEFIDILHTSSLLVDDVEDDGKVRRGKVCAHRIYGIANTINAGNLMYFKAWEKLQLLNNNDNNGELSKIFVNSMVKLHTGQGMEIYWRDNEKCPSEKEYLSMVIGKTGELFKLGVNIMGHVSNKRNCTVTDKLNEYCEILGMIYQIKNDLNDLELHGKLEEDFGHDLDEGKYSFPILYCINEKNATFKNVKSLGKMTQKQKLAVIDQIVTLGGVSYASERLQQLTEHANGIVNNLSEAVGPTMVQQLKEVIQRVK